MYTILIADDEAEIVELLRLYLEKSTTFWKRTVVLKP